MLSGGQFQKVIIGRALAQKTRILLLDEPRSNLDIRHKLEILQLLKKLTVEGHTIIIAIHDINLALQFCDQFILLKEGKVFAAGDSSILTSEILSELYEVSVEVLECEQRKFIFQNI